MISISTIEHELMHSDQLSDNRHKTNTCLENFNTEPVGASYNGDDNKNTNTDKSKGIDNSK